MKVERIRKAYEQVADQLLSMINSGELKPGDRLPSEAELAADFGVSRTTVREALRILATRNLIQTRKGMAGGHFIVEPTVGSISEFLVANYGLLTAANTVTLEHLLQAREMIEGPAAAIAARNRDENDLERIRSALSDDIESVSVADALANFRNFHLYLLEATKNHLLVVAAAPIFTVLQSTVVRRRPTKEVIAQLEARPPGDLPGGGGPGRGRGAPADGRAPRLPARQLPARHQLDRGLRPAEAREQQRRTLS